MNSENKVRLLAVTYCIVYMLCCSFSLSAVQPNLQVIEKEHLSVIYDAPDEYTAKEVLNDLSIILPAYRELLDVKHPFNWPVILSSVSSSPSGYVSLPVRRTVWQTTPYNSFFSGSQWLHLLALHEGRHMAQYEALDRGVSRLLYVVGGTELMTSFGHAFVPGWIFEGDAVISETRYSYEGRGRSAEFERRLRALLIEHPEVTWSQVVNGSYYHAYPNEYLYGYYMMGYLLREYGEEGISQVFSTMGWIPIPFVSPSIALSSVTGRLSTVGSYFETVKDDLRRKWSADLAERVMSPRTIIYSPRIKGCATIADFRVDHHILSLMQYDRSHGATFRTYDLHADSDPETHGVRIPSATAAMGSSYLAWIEQRSALFDPDTTESVLVLSDVSGKHTRDAATGIFTGTPAFSSDGRRVAVVSYDLHRGSAIQIYDVVSAARTETISMDIDFFMGEIIWAGDVLYGVREGKEGRDLVRFTASGESEILIHLGHVFVHGLAVEDSTLFFGSDASGIDEIYSLDLVKGDLRQLTSSRYGVWDPYISDGTLYAIELDSFDRDVIVELDHYTPKAVDTRTWKTDYLQTYYMPDMFSTEMQSNKEVHSTSYRSIDWMFTPYAWGVFLPERVNELVCGVKFSDPFAADVTSLSVGYQFDTKTMLAHASWGHDGDVIDLTVNGDLWHDMGTSSAETPGFSFLSGVSTTMYKQSYGNSLKHTAGVYGQVLSTNLPEYPLLIGMVDTVSYGRVSPYRSLIPYDLGIAHVLRAAAALGSETPAMVSDMITLYGNGLFSDDGFILQHEGIWRTAGGTQLSWSITPARGYTWDEDIVNLALSHELIGTISCMYRFPLWYPDRSLLGFSYVKRIRGELFYDHTYGDGGYRSSLGLEVLADMTFFNSDRIELTSGVRTSWRLYDNRFVFELILLRIPFS